MSELTARNSSRSWLGMAAMMLASRRIASYALALFVDDGFYTVCGLAGIAAFLIGRKARRTMEHGRARTLTLLATIVGALAGAVVIVCTAAFAVSYLV